MEICVCVKRVPMVGGAIVVTPDELDVDTTMAGFTVSPHEECGVEEAVRITERLGGSVTVLTLGPPSAADQLRDMLALGASRAILLRTDGTEWGPIATAAAIADALRGGGSGNPGARPPGAPRYANPGARPPGAPRYANPGARPPGALRYDLLVFGNEAADTGGYQVPVRVAHRLGLPCVTGVKRLEVIEEAESKPGHIVAAREYSGVQETFDVPLPAVVSVKEGINLPRYPSLPGRLRAKRATIETVDVAMPVAGPGSPGDGLVKRGLRVPVAGGARSEVLGSGAEAVPALVRLLDELGVLR